MDGLDKLTQDDRFELLSAYIDDEVSASERQQVEAWLSSDSDFQQQYQALSSLSRSLQSLPTYSSTASADEMLEAVFSRVERKPRKWVLAGIGTAAIAVISSLGILLDGTDPAPQVAKKAPPQTVPALSTQDSNSPANPVDAFSSKELALVDTDSLMLVLEEPPVDIPVVKNENNATGSGQ